MDLSWLGNIFGSLLKVFSPLKGIKHWAIWLELKNWYTRFKKWRDWYRDHIMQPMRAQQQALAKIRDQFITPVIRLLDHVRQLTSIIGIFNKKLANKLNYQFLRIETYLLTPFNQALSRINSMGRIFQSILTPLGFLDRGLLLNSIWRDAALVKGILHNPFDQHPGVGALTPGPTTTDRISNVRAYLEQGSGPYAADLDAAALHYRETLAGA